MLAGSAFALLEVAEQVALTHHEKWDGSGYPNGLAGEDDPDRRAHRGGGRRLRRADARAAVQGGVEQSRRASPRSPATRDEHFDPQVVDAFLGGFQREVRSLA